MKQFEVGSVYYCRSARNHDCIFLIKVVSRAAKSILISRAEDGARRRVKLRVDENGVEWVIPEQYSMAPVYRADRLYSDGIA